MHAYEILQVDANASVADVKRAFRRRAYACHPDHGGDPREFQELRAAYVEALRQAASRAQRIAPVVPFDPSRTRNLPPASSLPSRERWPVQRRTPVRFEHRHRHSRRSWLTPAGGTLVSLVATIACAVIATVRGTPPIDMTPASPALRFTCYLLLFSTPCLLAAYMGANDPKQGRSIYSVILLCLALTLLFPAPWSP